MSVIGSNILAGASGQGGGYNLTRSLRFRRSASANLGRTPSSATNRKTYTWSAWVKRGLVSNDQVLFSAENGSGNYTVYQINNSGQLEAHNSVSGVGGSNFATSAVFRDPSAWYHIVFQVDTTQATLANRVRVYVNGVLQTWGTNGSTAFDQNRDTWIDNNNVHFQGQNPTFGGNFFDGYLTEINFIDGQALTPSSFGETSTTTGVWQPKRYTGTYGTNGFYLPFSDNTSTTTLGADSSGNGNNWTTNNISLTAGATYDSMTDVPTLTSATASNFAVLNPILQNGWWAAPSRGAISNGNLRLSQNNGTAFSTFDVSTSGKWYVEGTVTSYGQTSSQSEFIVSAKSRSTFEISYLQGGQKTINGSNSSYGASWTTGDVIGIAIDPANNQVTFYKNGTSQGAITNTFPSETVLVGYYAEATGTDTIDFNFGSRPFAFSPPTGFVALNTFNLPTPTIGATASSQANKYFDAVTWTGTGSNPRNITTLNFQPDFVWLKARSLAGQANQIVDVVRGYGTSAMNTIITNQTTAEESDETNGGLTVAYGNIQSLNSNGFTVDSGAASADQTNKLNESYVAWALKANGTGVTNTAGSITSTVSANTSSGFSIVTYTGQASDGTVGHGLGVAPKMIIVKNRTTGGNNWVTYHASLPSPNVSIIYMNTTGAVLTGVGTWNSTAPTSTVFSVDGGDSQVNTGSNNFVAYCFSEVQGYSKAFSYTGNGSTDGTFVHLGFLPRFILLKRTDSTGAWYIYDTARDTFNVANKRLVPSDSVAESSDINTMDILSNGFKLRDTTAVWNSSGGSYVGIAFASNPFKYSLAR